MIPSNRLFFSTCTALTASVFIISACGSSHPTVSNGAEVSSASDASIDPSRELLITDLSVVNDSRTVYNPSGGDNQGGQQGGDQVNDSWSFGRLMENMAGDHPVSDFVLRWLRTWETNQYVNGFTAPARPNIRSIVIDPWRVASGCPRGNSPCTLDFTKAPFRLLAIVYRPDLRTFINGRGNAGQGRFVFGTLDSIGRKLLFTVIFEYALLTDDQDGVFAWAQRFHELNGVPFGAEFNDKLQPITDGFAGKDVNERGVNHSALLQLRTNEVALVLSPCTRDADCPGSSCNLTLRLCTSRSRWELREFTLSRSTRYLQQATVKQTPDLSFNQGGPNAARLVSFLNDPSNHDAILSGTAQLPASFLGASAIFFGPPLFPPPNFSWNAQGVNEDLRHAFALNTCSGCHLNETATRFLQVAPRDAGVAATISAVLRDVFLPQRSVQMSQLLAGQDDEESGDHQGGSGEN